ncbi:MAG: DTW domain-containing protein [Lentisphaeraceae bacterium]|nr:DTW domain-containing protein [Lentisphaeraceae bacterium]
MKREVCPGCERPVKVCLCAQLKVIENLHSVTVLRHKSETKHALNTVKILEKSLSKISVFDGELFPENSLPQHKNSYLIYPSDDAVDISDLSTTEETHFIFLDGSWKKTSKILHLNPWLEKIPKVKLPYQESRYYLRKQKDNGFSTLEAVYAVLSTLEKNQPKYQGLLDTLDYMMQLQSDFIEPATFKEHFGDRLS